MGNEDYLHRKKRRSAADSRSFSAIALLLVFVLGDAVFVGGVQHGHQHPEDALGDQLPPTRPHHVSKDAKEEGEEEGQEEKENGG